MKKIVLTIFVFAFIANLSAQLKVDTLGNVEIGGIIATTNNAPITFKVNGYLVGSTGYTSNVSFGFRALSNLPEGGANTAMGCEALLNNKMGIMNTATGNYALLNNTAGDMNTATGSFALPANTSGEDNTANGAYTLFTNTTGSMNTANGYNALFSNTWGENNTAIGALSLYSNAGGKLNTAIGYSALSINETGNFNTAIGMNSNVSSNNLSNATAIGCGAFATGSDQVIIGNSSVKSIGGFAGWSNFSDGRAKKNVKANVPGLDFINRLQPVTYNLDLDAVDNLLGIDKMKKDRFEKDMPQELKVITEKSRKAKQEQVQTGFVAQDVEKTAKSIGYNFSGVNVDESGIYSLSYAEFVVPLVKAVQELSGKNAQLQEQVNELTGLVNKLLGKEGDPSIFRSENSGASVTELAELALDANASLEQNVPNPFNHTTVIHYTLPETCTSAKILITNTGGHVIQQIPLSVSGGHDSITIKGGSLQAGVYLYSLICDGKVVDTKRMILTK